MRYLFTVLSRVCIVLMKGAQRIAQTTRRGWSAREGGEGPRGGAARPSCGGRASSLDGGGVERCGLMPHGSVLERAPVLVRAGASGSGAIEVCHSGVLRTPSKEVIRGPGVVGPCRWAEHALRAVRGPISRFEWKMHRGVRGFRFGCGRSRYGVRCRGFRCRRRTGRPRHRWEDQWVRAAGVDWMPELAGGGASISS